MTTTADSSPADLDALLAEVDRLAAHGRSLEALDLLSSEAGAMRKPKVERRLAELRHQAFRELPQSGADRWPVSRDGIDPTGPPRIPEIQPADLDADTVRRRLHSDGSLLVRGLFTDQAAQFVEAIETALSAQENARADGGKPDRAWIRPLPLPKEEAGTLGRFWVAATGGLLSCDSPRLLQMLFRSYEDAGLREVVHGYFGERPVLSGNKCTMRRVPLTANTDWHQDGAFLGSGIRALNIWIALTDCGVDSPGMDLVPKRLDRVVETGTGGAYFDWAVGSTVVDEIATEAPVVRPVFNAGDALLFDDLFLHRTAIDDMMTRPRYAIESWFFAPTDYPDGQVPLVW